MDQIKFAVIHSLDKEAKTTFATVRSAKAVLDITNPRVVQLAEQLSKLVGKDGSSVFYGQFSHSGRGGQFPPSVLELCNDQTTDNFLATSNLTMEELRKQASKQNLSTGGIVCFIVYRVDSADFLLVAMIKERDALRLNEAMVPEEIKEIDLSKLHQAARVNLHRYLDFISVDDAADQQDDSPEKTYLCFVSRKTQATDVASYFIEALGCEKGTSTVRTTKTVLYAVKNFVSITDPIATYSRIAQRKVIDYLHKLEDGTVVSLETICAVVKQSLPPELSHHVDPLVEYLNNETNQIPEEFAVSSKAIKPFIRITASSANHTWNFSVDDSALGSSNSEVVYDSKKKSLTFTTLSAKTIADVEATLHDREAAEKSQEM